MSLRSKTSSPATHRCAVLGLALGLSISVSGCGAGLGQGTSSIPSSTSASYGDVIGSGKKVETPAGSYETIAVDKNSALNIFNDGKGNPAGLEAKGWTQEDGASGQKLAVKYVTHEFLDSTALEGGAPEFATWLKTDATTYLTAAASKQAAAPTAQGVALSNAKGKVLMPKLIHDGKPRVKNVDLKLTGFMNYDEGHGIIYSFDFTADYRVSDADAAAFVGAQFTDQSGDEFIKSDKTKPQMKDGTGENVYRGKGFANVILDKDETGVMKIVGVTSKAEFNTDDFTY